MISVSEPPIETSRDGSAKGVIAAPAKDSVAVDARAAASSSVAVLRNRLTSRLRQFADRRTTRQILDQLPPRPALVGALLALAEELDDQAPVRRIGLDGSDVP